MIDPTVYGSMPDEQFYEKYYISNTFINIFAQSANETLYDSKGPYRIGIRVTGENDKKIVFSIHNIEIISVSGIDYSRVIKEKFPISVAILSAQDIFNPMSLKNTGYFYTAGTFFIEEYFDFQKYPKDEIYINVCIEVMSDDNLERKEIKCTLTPVFKKGIFQPIW